MKTEISGRTGLYCLIGSPVGHSGSPAMHNYSFQRTGVDAVYLAFDVTLGTLPDAIRAIRTLGIRGFNITMPCKTAVMEYLDEISPAAALIGACNTVTVSPEGRLAGYNTDGIGFLQNLRCHGVEIRGRHMVMLGTGGAAMAICAQAALDGARCITICSRSPSSYRTACGIAGKLEKAAPGTEVRAVPLADREAFAREVAAADILVNGTKAGMAPLDGETLVEPSLFRPELAVADVVYNRGRRGCFGRPGRPAAGPWWEASGCCCGRGRRLSACSPARRCQWKKCSSGCLLLTILAEVFMIEVYEEVPLYAHEQ